MFSVTVFRCSFTSSWKMLCLAVVGILLCVNLGIWQLHRAAEKRTWLALYQTQIHKPAILLEQNRAIQQYQQVLAQGKSFLPIVLLLDNQHHAHQFGYDVLRPLVLADGKVVLINHGWVPGDVSRQSLPEITFLPEQLQYSGQAYYPSKHPLILGKGIEIKTQHIAVIEALNIAMISQFLHKSMYPFIIRQSIEQSSNFVRDWPIIAGSPVRHIGYAVQWFLFALIIAIIYIILHISRLD